VEARARTRDPPAVSRPSRRRRTARCALLGALLAAFAGCGERTSEPPALAAASGEPPPLAAASEEPPARAVAAVTALRTRLLAALTEALAEDPESAIDACRVEAPRIAREIAAEGVAVGRTSHRVRNPANAPEPWMLPLLDAYRAPPPPPPEPWRTVDLGERGIGYVEPIYLQPLCATCHGEAVEPELLARIRAHYPDDQATGFRVGELRGLFWTVVPRDAAP